MNSIYTALIGSIVPLMYPIRSMSDGKTIMEEFPLVEVLKAERMAPNSQYHRLRVKFFGGIKSGEEYWLCAEDVMAF